jgi:electron transfer flavoprotein alpha subunit
MAKKEIWVFAELSNGSPVNVFYELLGKADEIAKAKDWDVASVIIGSDISAAVEEIRSHTDKIYKVENDLFKDYTLEKYALAMEALIKEYKPEMVLIGASGIGSELAPTTAGKVRTGLAAHAIDIVVDEERDRINCMVPAFGGKVVSEIYIPEARPMMCSVRPGILDCIVCHRECKEVVEFDAAFLSNAETREEFLEFTPEVIEGVKLEEANVVVAAGRGVSEAGWASINEVANKLGGAVAWSRNFIDTGMVDSESNMIGTSGKSVKPAVFIGAGISGAAHFIVGMTKSKLIINVNKDEKAKIFNQSDYGVVGDAAKFMSALNELL